MNNNVIDSILNIIHACDSVQLATCALNGYPETRHVMNEINKNATDLGLYFLTTVGSPKYEQLQKNPRCCLYYFNPKNRHAVRLFGQMKFVDNTSIRKKYWRDEYKSFGYTGADDARLAFMKFSPDEYKFYIGNELITGKV